MEDSAIRQTRRKGCSLVGLLVAVPPQAGVTPLTTAHGSALAEGHHARSINRQRAISLRTTRKQSPRHSCVHGVTLIEVLVALVVLSIGVIGLAALQAQALQLNQGAYVRAQATNLAYDIADRMRTNRRAALDGAYDTDFQTPVDCEAPDTGSSLAETDLTQWRTALACALPEGQGRIERAGDLFTITIRWDNRRLAEDEDETAEVFVTRTGI